MVRTLRVSVMTLRFVLPWVMRAAGFTGFLVLTAAASTWLGIPTAVSRIANRWLEEANKVGFPTRYSPLLYYLLCAVATVIIVAGWIAQAYLTVWLVDKIL